MHWGRCSIRIRHHRSLQSIPIEIHTLETHNEGRARPMHRSMKPRKTAGSRRTLSRLPLAAAICFAVSAAYAQDAPAPQAADPAPQEQTPPAQERTATLETVTVTSQKRSENLQKVPISLEVLGEEKLDELN